ncbi:hypothetical protein CAEBREN_05682 [Caenorhabditis brenneri]|uniref:UBX domain-containing protein n=1 Tax=Caenorhabditis brenneri TaxID=135651 RepID=G0P832_CAEBE|nr:hypothetical protein CAEBREN_05682 [Caenorhabditis brenneri]
MSSFSSITSNLSAEQKQKLEFFMDMVNTTDETASISTLTQSNWELEAAISKHGEKNECSNDSDEDEDEDEEEDMDCYEDEEMEYEDDDSAYESNTRSSSTSSGSLFPKELEEIDAAIENFSAEFKKRYGVSLPFFSGELEDAIRISKDSNRPILFFITNDKSVASNIFISQVILSENVCRTLMNDFILYPWDVTEADHLERLVTEFEDVRLHMYSSFLKMYSQTQLESFPLLLPLTQTRRDPEVPSFAQSSDSIDAVIAKLVSASEEFRLANRTHAARRRESEEREQIRRLQEEAYQASLAEDLARFAKIKEEEKQKKMEEERLKKELEEEQRLKEEEEARQGQVAQMLPSEPAADEPGVLMVKFRLPEGKQAMRRFRQSETIKTLAMYLDSQGYSSQKFKYFNSDFPKKNVMVCFSEEQSFSDVKWPTREQIFVEEI